MLFSPTLPAKTTLEVLLKMKLMYMTKRQRDIKKQVSKDIVENSKVFNKNF